MSTKRTSFHFPREAAASLEAIMEHSRSSTAAETIRAALSAYGEVLEVAVAGCKIAVRDHTGVEWPYSPFKEFIYPGSETRRSTKTKSVIVPARNFFFSGKAVQMLEAIRERCFVKSNADAIRVALSAYSELVGVVAMGGDILIRDRLGRERSYDPRGPMRTDGLDLSGVTEAVSQAGVTATNEQGEQSSLTWPISRAVHRRRGAPDPRA